VAPAAPAAPERRDDGGVDITLTTADGIKLAATHWLGPASNDRCVVLVHQLGSTREEWAPLIAKLRGKAEILAFDLRGHGDSRRGPHGLISYRDFNGTDWGNAVRDLDAATAWLGERGYRASDCIYVGSSIGSTLVIRWAGAHPDAGALVLLSPGLDYQGLNILDAAAKFAHPVLVVYSGEPGMSTTINRLAQTWGTRVELEPVEGIEHGISMLTDDRARLAQVIEFLTAAGTTDAPATPPP
jgi:alpha-beta hydrolase superfamily lysophospholipase